VKNQLVCRREFNGFCAALGLSAAIGATTAVRSNAPTLAAASNTGPGSPMRMVKLPEGIASVPALGQGSWHLAQGRHPEAVEEDALRTGLSLGMTLIDTAEMYSNGRSEQLINRVIVGQRDHVFLVSKVLPNHTAGDGIIRACEASLERLGTDHLDLYLLHWRNPDTDLSRVVAGFERLRAERKVRAWGVSNFGVGDMEDLFRVTDGNRCATNQVRYNLAYRLIEYDLLPWCAAHGIPLMAYSPLGGDASLLRDPELARIAAEHGCSAAAVALAWTMRSGNVIAIPESGSPAHVKENAVALSLTLTPEELQRLDDTHPIQLTDFLRWQLRRGRRWLRNIWKTQ
jgi:diketogulonate reductase-like aldo/keto reductase